MKQYILLLLITALFACGKKDHTLPPDPVLGPVLEAKGKLSDYAPVDGCGLHLVIQKDTTKQIDYAISDKSALLIKPYIVYKNGVLDVPVMVQFQQTGRKKDVFCGWVGNTPFDEVLILSIKGI